jgi:hypothetical protein
LHLFLKSIDVVCQLPKAFRCSISQAILIMIPVAGKPANDPAYPEEDVAVPELRNQFKVPGCNEFVVEFLEQYASPF